MKYEEHINPVVDSWVVLGLDPSLSRTGVALMTIDNTGHAEFKTICSLAPTNSAVESWLRSKSMGKYIADNMIPMAKPGERLGLVICLEAATIGNDFLQIVSSVLKAALFASPAMMSYERIIFTHINAATLRSVMALTKKGNNKDENIEKAYTYIDRVEHLGLDSDACDAVLMAMMGRWTVALLQGMPKLVPEKAMQALTSEVVDMKKRGKKDVPVMKGIMNNPRYWFEVNKDYNVSLVVRDSRLAKRRRLEPLSITL